MYRIAIVEKDPDAREEIHRLAALFFTRRKESAAFVICETRGDLPPYYDCYLLGDERCVALLRGPEEAALETVSKPLEEAKFFEMLEKWRSINGAAAVRTPKKRRGISI
ncbi:MAG: hypothetical protein RRY97_04980 [Oscillibacter sp.]